MDKMDFFGYYEYLSDKLYLVIFIIKLSKILSHVIIIKCCRFLLFIFSNTIYKLSTITGMRAIKTWIFFKLAISFKYIYIFNTILLMLD